MHLHIYSFFFSGNKYAMMRIKASNSCYWLSVWKNQKSTSSTLTFLAIILIRGVEESRLAGSKKSAKSLGKNKLGFNTHNHWFPKYPSDVGLLTSNTGQSSRRITVCWFGKSAKSLAINGLGVAAALASSKDSSSHGYGSGYKGIK